MLHSPPFLLASSSPYRAKLLSQFGVPFDTFSPNIDESPEVGESANTLAFRLSQAKANAVADKFPEHIIIASDQVACIKGTEKPLGKPNTRENAIAQLTQCSSKTVHFYTGLSVIMPSAILKHASQGRQQTIVETFDVNFRALTQTQIEAYIDIELPLDCAGSFKAEGLGIALFDSFSGRDHNTLIGLPLMALNDCLKTFDVDLMRLAAQHHNSIT